MKANEFSAAAGRMPRAVFSIIAALALLFAFGGWGCSGKGDNPSPGPAGSGGVSAGGSSGSSGGGSGGSSGDASTDDGQSGSSGSSGTGGSKPDADAGEASEAGGSSGSETGSGGSSGSSGDASTDDGAAGSSGSDAGDADAQDVATDDGSAGSSGDASTEDGGLAETGDSGGSGGSDAGDAKDSTSEPPPPKPFKCSGWTRDLTFPSGLDLTGDIWGSGPNDIYVATGKYDTHEMAHYDGQGWSLMTPPTNGRFLNQGAVWGSGTNDVWASGEVNNKAVVLRRMNGGAWQADLILATWQDSVRSIWGTDANNVFAVVWIDGGQSSWDAKIFRRNGDGTWSPMTLPPHAPPWVMRKIWGKSATEVYAVGTRLDAQKNGIKAILWKYDGNGAWQDASLFPSDVVGLAAVHGANSEVWVVGAYKNGANLHGVRLSSTDFMSWDRYDSAVTQSENVLWSPWQGAALVGGSKPVPPLPGAAQTSTLSLGSWTAESSLDGIAGYVTGIWPVPNSNQVWLSTYSTTGNAGVYKGACQ